MIKDENLAATLLLLLLLLLLLRLLLPLREYTARCSITREFALANLGHAIHVYIDSQVIRKAFPGSRSWARRCCRASEGARSVLATSVWATARSLINSLALSLFSIPSARAPYSQARQFISLYIYSTYSITCIYV